MARNNDPHAVQQYEHETWSRCAEGYLDGFSGLTLDTLPPPIEAAGIGDGSYVLEVGSGPGHTAETLTQAGASVVSIDAGFRLEPPFW